MESRSTNELDELSRHKVLFQNRSGRLSQNYLKNENSIWDLIKDNRMFNVILSVVKGSVKLT